MTIHARWYKTEGEGGHCILMGRIAWRQSKYGLPPGNAGRSGNAGRAPGNAGPAGRTVTV